MSRDAFIGGCPIATHVAPTAQSDRRFPKCGAMPHDPGPALGSMQALRTLEKGMSRPLVEAACCPQGSALLVADVGGTYARLGWASTGPGGSPQIHDFRRYACADYPSLAAILRDYLDALADDPQGPQPRRAVVAIAGLLEGDHLLNTNLPWPVSVAATRDAAQLERLALINDFTAVAHAIPYVDPGAMVCLTGENAHTHQWPALVLGAGTGLGAALSLDGDHPQVLPSEVGHAALAPGNMLELDILRLLMQRFGHVDNERVLSGPGLVNLYACLCELRAFPVLWHSPGELIHAAERQGDALARESIQIFCDWLGSVVGDLVIAFGARAVYLTGGITGHLAAPLQDGRFLQRYLAKGALSQTLHQVPVWRIEHGQLGALGAAAWYAQQPPDAWAIQHNQGENP